MRRILLFLAIVSFASRPPDASPGAADPENALNPPAQSVSSEFQWGEVYVSLENPAIPLFHIELSRAADRLEIRIYDVALEIKTAKNIFKPARLRGNAAVYEYHWRNASEMDGGVYFYILRASKKGRKTLETLKHFRLMRREEK